MATALTQLGTGGGAEATTAGHSAAARGRQMSARKTALGDPGKDRDQTTDKGGQDDE